MKLAVHHAPHSIRAGEVGSHVELHLTAADESEWSGVYSLSSHGMAPEAFADRVSEIQAYHTKKSARLSGFVKLRQADIQIGDETYRISDCNLRERGRDVEIALVVSRVDANGDYVRVLKMDARDGLIYPSIDAAPDDGALLRSARAAVIFEQGHAETHAQFVAAVGALMEG